MKKNAVAYNSSILDVSFALKNPSRTISLNATINNNPELIHQN